MILLSALLYPCCFSSYFRLNSLQSEYSLMSLRLDPLILLMSFSLNSPSSCRLEPLPYCLIGFRSCWDAYNCLELVVCWFRYRDSIVWKLPIILLDWSMFCWDVMKLFCREWLLWNEGYCKEELCEFLIPFELLWAWYCCCWELFIIGELFIIWALMYCWDWWE